jgi:hypothetical protein
LNIVVKENAPVSYLRRMKACPSGYTLTTTQRRSLSSRLAGLRRHEGSEKEGKEGEGTNGGDFDSSDDDLRSFSDDGLILDNVILGGDYR